jgi:hypothetical protein
MLQLLIEPWTIVLVALAGVILLCVAVIGLDARRARRDGPRWGRRVAAGVLALLSVVGVYFAAKRHPMNQPPRVMCYAVMIEPPPPKPAPSPGAEVRNLQIRLDLLWRLGRDGRIAPQVVDLAASTLRTELASAGKRETSSCRTA